MIAIKTGTLCLIASELDEAIDKLDPNNPAFPAVMNARALYRYHLMGKLPEQRFELYDEPLGYESAEPGYGVDAAGTFEG
jgi:hypothetical protein